MLASTWRSTERLITSSSLRPLPRRMPRTPELFFQRERGSRLLNYVRF